MPRAQIQLPPNYAYPKGLDLEIDGQDDTALNNAIQMIQAQHQRDGMQAYTDAMSGKPSGAPPEGFSGPLTPAMQDQKDLENDSINNAGLLGAGDVVKGMAIGGVKSFLGGLAGTAALVGGTVADAVSAPWTGWKNWGERGMNATFNAITDPGEPRQQVKDHANIIGDAFSAAPVSTSGEDVEANLGAAQQWVGNKEDKLFGAAGLDEHPIVATVLHTALSALAADAVGGFGEGTITGFGLRAIRNRAAVRELNQQLLDKFGVVPGSPQIREEIAQAGKDRASEYRGADVGQLGDKTRYEADVNKMRTDTLAEGAREYNTAIPTDSFAQVADDLEQELRARFDMEDPDMGKANRLITRLRDMDKNVYGGTVENPNPRPANVTPSTKLSYIENMRQSLSTDIGQAQGNLKGALMTAKHALDDHITAMFAKDMIVGDPEALAAWKDVYKNRTEYSYLFEKDNAIDKMLSDMDASGADIKAYLLNKNSITGKTGSLGTLQRLRKIFPDKADGTLSPEMNGIAKEMSMDVIEPLMKDPPNLRSFIDRYDQSMRQNREVIQFLDPYASSGLDEVVKLARAAEKSGSEPPLFETNMNKILAQVMFGNELSRSAMKRSLAEKVLTQMRGHGPGKARSFIREYLGYDPMKSVAPVGSATWTNLQAEKIGEPSGNTSGQTEPPR